MTSVQDLDSEELTLRLTYAGLVLVGFELMRRMIVTSIKAFYDHTTFGQGMPFKSYEDDVRTRATSEFEACVLYLRDFMGAIDASDMATIQELRTHRNELAHDLVRRLPSLLIDESLWDRVDHTLFRLSNYRTRMEIGASPLLRDVEWESVNGHEHLLFEHIVQRVKVMKESGPRGVRPRGLLDVAALPRTSVTGSSE